MEKAAVQLHSEKRGVRICEKKSSADTKANEKCGGGNALDTREEW